MVSVLPVFGYPLIPATVRLVASGAGSADSLVTVRRELRRHYGSGCAAADPGPGGFVQLVNSGRCAGPSASRIMIRYPQEKAAMTSVVNLQPKDIPAKPGYSRFSLVVGVLAWCAVSHSQAGAAALAGGLGYGGTRSRSAGSEQVRYRISDQEACLRVAASGVATRNGLPSPPTSEGVITLPDVIRPGSVRWAGLYWEVLGNSIPRSQVRLNGTAVNRVPLPISSIPTRSLRTSRTWSERGTMW